MSIIIRRDNGTIIPMHMESIVNKNIYAYLDDYIELQVLKNWRQKPFQEMTVVSTSLDSHHMHV